MTQKNLESLDRISNGISVARIISMFWIVAVNYLPVIFNSFYGVDYQDTMANAENYVKAASSNPWLIDKILFLFSRADWAGVTIFAFFTGFSLWLSILNARTFRIGDYLLKRFNSIYVPYFIAVVVAVFVGIAFSHLPALTSDIAAMLLGGAAFAPGAAQFDPPTWFISMVFLCYLFFPLIPIIYSRFRFLGVLSFTIFSYAILAYYGSSYFFYYYGPLYPLLPFWLFLCFGVVVCHLIYRYQHTRVRVRAFSFAALNSICLPVIGLGAYLLYRYFYVGPSSGIETTWTLPNAFPAALAGALAFFAIGYVLPAKSFRFLRWLSRGTLGVFLYHWIAMPVLAPYLGAHLLTGHLSIALAATYLPMLVLASLFQDIIDKTIIKWTRSLSSRKFEIV